MTAPSTPTAATLAVFLKRLRDYEPDLFDMIAATTIALSPERHPLLLLHSKKFRRLQAAVRALPHGWRHRTRTTLCPSIRQRLNTILTHIPRELLTIVPEIVTPQPHNRIRIEYRPHPENFLDVPAGLRGLFCEWDVYYRAADPAEYPLAKLSARGGHTHEYRHVPLTHRTLIQHWDARPQNGKNYIQLFDKSFPADVGRLLYAVATYYAQGEDKTIAQHHPARQRRIIGEHCREYNRIKKTHIPESPRRAKGQLVADRQWLKLLGTSST